MAKSYVMMVLLSAAVIGSLMVQRVASVQSARAHHRVSDAEEDVKDVKVAGGAEKRRLLDDLSSALDKKNSNSQRTVNDGINEFRWFGSAKRYYRLVMEQADWARAADQCNTFHENAHLAFVTSTTEKQAVKALLDDVKSRLGSAFRSACTQRKIMTDIVWIGGQRIGSSTRFGWKTDRYSSPQPMTYTNWSPDGEPNNRGGNENCISIYGDLNWNDFSCDEPACFICQI